ncbi:MAG TPA: hypothetical protein VNG12_16265, partial [Acidimicrobiales bacterium]|nr:hypothetical protein [Acidimicrobiales bacterium]
AGTTGGFNFRQFVYPGVVAMSVVMTAMFSALPIAWDREFGFLREMLVAPVNRTSLVAGKTVGGATVAAVQGTCGCRDGHPQLPPRLSCNSPSDEDVPVLSFLYLAFVRVVQLVCLFGRSRNDLAIEIVILRHEVAVLRRQVD